MIHTKQLIFADMNKALIPFLILAFIVSCGNDNSQQTESSVAENEDDAARNFIRSVLDQDFEKARTMIIPDSLNNQYLDLTERQFKKMGKADKYHYRKSTIQNYTTRMVNDSVIIAYYTNSHTRISDSIKLVKQNGEWLVDLKYTFPETKQIPQ
jgi:hypothetical protein